MRCHHGVAHVGRLRRLDDCRGRVTDGYHALPRDARGLAAPSGERVEVDLPIRAFALLNGLGQIFGRGDSQFRHAFPAFPGPKQKERIVTGTRERERRVQRALRLRGAIQGNENLIRHLLHLSGGTHTLRPRIL